jgi:hypothetical protein
MKAESFAKQYVRTTIREKIIQPRNISR